jgi:hypothetical protein
MKVVTIRKKQVWWTLAAAASAIVALFLVAAVALRTGALRPRVISALADALNCDVTLDQLDVQLVPLIKVTGSGLSIRLRGRPEFPPYIEVSRFTVNLGLLSVLRRHVDTVHLDGLHLNVPPGLDAAGLSGSDATAHPAPAPRRALFSVDHVVASEASLSFVGKENHNRPLSFAIHNLDLHDADIEHAMHFTASVSNPVPEGLVTLDGAFGPWNRDDPTQTSFAGSYGLESGDLGTINGIGGHAASKGNFTGRLTEIRVIGTGRAPDFSLDLGGKPLPLLMSFVVTVDGTNGTTRLNQVDAVLIDTPVRVVGAVTNLPGPGHSVNMKVDVRGGRIEDLLQLAFDSDRPMLTGDVSMSATLDLPPGSATTRQRLEATGTFGLGGVHFTDKDMQQKLQELSRRGQGKNQDEIVSRVATAVTGQFSLKHGVVTMPRLAFAVPGATIALTGRYTMGSEALDFTGTAQLKASLSQAVGGFKSIFIKPLNRFFSKNGTGATIKIMITGTRKQPVLTIPKGQIFDKEK